MKGALRAGAGLLMALIASSLMVTGASAATITIGQTAPPSTAGDGCSACTLFQGTTGSSSPSYRVPVQGTLTSWSVQAQSGGCVSGCTARLRVFAPLSGNTFALVYESTDETIDNGLKTFPAALGVVPGELLGIEGTNGVRFYPGGAGDRVALVQGNPAPATAFGACPGSPCYFNTNANTLVNLSATLSPVTPAVQRVISPGCGPAAGGAVIGVMGGGFTGATAVAFGSANASSFTVVGDAYLTAIAPPGLPGQKVDVTVTTPGGTSPVGSWDQCAYDAAVGLPRAGVQDFAGGWPYRLPASALVALGALLATALIRVRRHR